MAESLIPDWSKLPEELLHLISTHLEDHCFDVIHARSVCTSWRSSFPFPSSLLRTSYSLPAFADFPIKGLCTLEKIHLILLRVRTPATAAALPSEYFWGQISRDESDDHTEPTSSSIQCSVKVKIPGYDPILMNMLDFQILSLSYKYRMVGWEREHYTGVAFLPLNKDGRRGEFVVLIAYCSALMVLTSAEMRWKRLENRITGQPYRLITFRGRFFVSFPNDKIDTIDPYSLEVTSQTPLQPLSFINFMVPSGDDALFIAELIIPRSATSDYSQFTCRVSRLDEEAGKWVEVSDLGARVLFSGPFGNGCCSAKELTDGCGMTGSLILFNGVDKMTYAYKYENLRNCWIFSEKKHGMILNSLW